MEALAAIGLAANIMQFVEYGSKILKEARRLYHSADGPTADNFYVESLKSGLENISETLRNPNSPLPRDEAFIKLLDRTKVSADAFLTELIEIKKKAAGRKGKSLREAVRIVFSKDKIKEMENALERLRTPLNFRMQIVILGEQSQTRAEIQKIRQDLRIIGTPGMDTEQMVNKVQTSLGMLQLDEDTISSSEQLKLYRSLASDLSELLKQNQARLEEKLLQSLYFERIQYRYDSIRDAHEETFQWALDPGSNTKFLQWLESGEGTYWISGKAGSGKSTLMKSLVEHEGVEVACKKWAGYRNLTVAKHFFWNAGSGLQKSQEGLLRSILFDILSKCPRLIQQVFADRLQSFVHVGTIRNSWSLRNLIDALQRISQSTEHDACFMIFIDGLDEYEGRPYEALEALSVLLQWPNAKICVSSRPLNEFINIFKRPGKSHLVLQDLTRECIRTFVEHRFQKSIAFTSLGARREEYQPMFDEIVQKADGVFLWVDLVVRSLLTGLQNADRLSQMKARLEELPSDLMDLLAHMLQQIEPVYRRQAALAFSVAISSDISIPLLTYSFLDDIEFADDENATGGVLSVSEIQRRHDQSRVRLNAHCKGLLEVRNSSPTQYARLFLTPTVQFLHLTARDFILTRNVQDMMKEWFKSEADISLRFCRALCNQLMRFDFDEYTEDFGYSMCRAWAVHAGRIRDATSQKIVFDQLASIAGKRSVSWMKSRPQLQRQSPLDVSFIRGALPEDRLYNHVIEYLGTHREIFEYIETEVEPDQTSHDIFLMRLFFGDNTKNRARFIKYYYQNLRISSLEGYEEAFKATMLLHDPLTPSEMSRVTQPPYEYKRILKVFDTLTPSNLRDCSAPEQLQASHERIRELLETGQWRYWVPPDTINELCRLCKEEEFSREGEQEGK